MRRTYGRDPLYGLLLTFGAALVLEELIRSRLGPNEKQMPLARSRCRARCWIGDLDLFALPLLRAGLACVMIGLLVVLHRSARLTVRSSRPARTTARWCGRWHQPVAAAPVRVALGVGLAAIAGVVMAPIWGVRPHVGVDAGVRRFLIIVLGGSAVCGGAVIAGLMVGMVVGLTVPYASEWSLLSMYLLFIGVVSFARAACSARRACWIPEPWQLT
jgi:branched-chain amino acid transport system permease protein